MSTAWTPGLTSILLGSIITPICAFGASVPNFPPDPVGEKLYRAELYHDTLLPVAIIGVALLATCVIRRITRKAHEADSAT